MLRSLSTLTFVSLAALASLSLGCSADASSTVPSSAEDGVVAAVSLETYTSDAAGFDTHAYWLDTGREVVVFDAQFTPAAAESMLASIRKKTRSPVAWVVVTHPNPDKFNGAEVFRREGAKVVASKRTAAALPGVHAYKKAYFTQVARSFTEETYPALATIDVTFDGSFRLPVTGVAVELHELTNAGVSSTQTVAYVPAAKALVVGDLVHGRAHAWLEGGIVDGAPRPDLASWKRALAELSRFGDVDVYGGRGDVLPREVATQEQTAYLDAADTIVGAYVKALGSRRVELSDPKASTAHWKALSVKLSERFPSYALPYMVEYGVYGLALSKARE
ncbi:MAG: MBL fold metallo-hydrolase [Myxococcales bacterium]|nr:MBL fold metallo-hydrolase [Myxococcales bacterium]